MPPISGSPKRTNGLPERSASNPSPAGSNSSCACGDALSDGHRATKSCVGRVHFSNGHPRRRCGLVEDQTCGSRARGSRPGCSGGKTKFAKSFKVCFFPVGGQAHGIVKEWIAFCERSSSGRMMIPYFRRPLWSTGRAGNSRPQDFHEAIGPTPRQLG